MVIQTSNWKPNSVLDCTGDELKVPYGEVTNSISNSGPLEIAAGSPCPPPPQNLRMTGSLVVYPSKTVM